ncbi:MAG: lipopolysaccharide biosynthesis protein [Planctomycetota bacterium]|jgi:O-antigen/teichoic acid export membrane protein
MGEARDVPPVATPEPGAWPGGLATWRARLTGPTARKGGWAVADQALVSGTRFVTAVMLARYTDPAEFGAFVLAAAALLSVNGLQAALVTGPMTVIGAPKEEDEFRRYVATLALAQLLGGAVLAALAFAAVGVMMLVPAAAGLRGAFGGMAAAVFFVQAQEFFRRVLFTRLLPSRVLVNDGLYCAMQLGGVFALWRLDASAGGAVGWLSGRNVFLCVAGSAFLAGLLGLWQVRGFLSRNLEGARAFMRENWRFGRWALGARLGGGLTTMGVRLIVAAFGGLVGAAVYEAPRLLLAPLQILTTGAGCVIVPRASQKHADGDGKALTAFMSSTALVVGSLFVGYAAIVAVAPEFWLQLLYGSEYKGAGGVLLSWVAVYVVLGLGLLPRAFLAATRRPRIAAMLVLVEGVLCLGSCLPIVSRWGVQGVLLARSTAGALMLIVATFVSWRVFKKEAVPVAH